MALVEQITNQQNYQNYKKDLLELTEKYSEKFNISEITAINGQFVGDLSFALMKTKDVGKEDTLQMSYANIRQGFKYAEKAYTKS